MPFVEAANIRAIGKGQTGDVKRQALQKVLESPLELFACPSRRLPQLYPYQNTPPLQNAIAPPKAAKCDYVINSAVSSEKSEIIIAEIQLHSGLSNTVMLGEKSLAQNHYTDGTAAGDMLSVYQGHCDDVSRGGVDASPTPDSVSSGGGFGSAHSGGCHFAYCDGSVKLVLFDAPPASAND